MNPNIKNNDVYSMDVALTSAGLLSLYSMPKYAYTAFIDDDIAAPLRNASAYITNIIMP